MFKTLELRISHFCDAGGHPLSAAVAILRQSNQVALAVQKSAAEEVVQVYGFCIRTLRLPVISVMIIGVMRLYNKRAVPDGRFRHHLFQAVFMRTTCPSRVCGQGSTLLWRPLLLLSLVRENAVKAGSNFKTLKLVRFKRP